MLNMASLYTQSLTWLNTIPRRVNPPAAVAQTPLTVDPQVFHQAFHLAYRCFAQQHSAWVSRRFDENFLRAAVDPTSLQQPRLTAAKLTLLWDKQFGPLSKPEVRIQHKVALQGVATDFMHLLTAEIAQS